MFFKKKLITNYNEDIFVLPEKNLPYMFLVSSIIALPSYLSFSNGGIFAEGQEHTSSHRSIFSVVNQ